MVLTRKRSFSLVIFPLTFLLTSTAVYAEASVTVKTEVSGNGTTQTHIKTNVNGAINEVNSNEPGKISVTNKDGKITIETKTDALATPNLSNFTPTPSAIPQIKNQENNLNQFKEQLQNFFSNFFPRLFRLFNYRA